MRPAFAADFPMLADLRETHQLRGLGSRLLSDDAVIEVVILEYYSF